MYVDYDGSDEYGKLIFSCSKDAEIEREQIVEELNKFQWDLSGFEWALNKDRIYYQGTAENPSTYPTYPEYFILQKDGVETTVHHSELDCELQRFIIDYEHGEWPLEHLSNAFARFINKGWIQITCITEIKSDSASLENLRIYSDGRAYRKSSLIESNKILPNTGDEEFDQFEEFLA